MLGLPHLDAPNQDSAEEPPAQKTQELSLSDLTFQKTQELSISDLTFRPSPTEASPEAGVLPVAEAGSDADDDAEPGEPALGSEPIEAPPAGKVGESHESLPELPLIADRSRTAFIVCACLVALSAGWLIYRFLAGPAA